MKPPRLVIAFCVAMIPASVAPEAAATEPVSVFVSILPQASFVERIGGRRVSVDVLVPPGESPATYAPTPKQMATLAKAAVFFRIGVPFEHALVPKIQRTMPKLLVVDTREGVPLRRMKAHHHEAEARSRHEGRDPHIWLSPVLVKRQAQTIYETLVRLDPEGKAAYGANYRAFVEEVNALHRRLTQALAPVRGKKLFVYHPSFGYLADTYGLEQVAVELEGREPTGKDLARFIKMAKAANVKVVFVQPQFSANSAQAIAEAIGGVVVSLDPLAKDYIGTLEAMATTIEQALAGSARARGPGASPGHALPRPNG